MGAGYRTVTARGECNLVRRSDSVMFTVRKSTRGAATKEVDFVRTSTPSGSLFAAKGIWLISTDIAGKHDVAAATKLAAALCPLV